MALITQYGLTAMDGLVIVGDAWGGLGTIFAALGFTVELTDSSQYIQDNWDTYGSPHVVKPTNTDSYLAVDRMQVRSQERNTGITDWWCIVADCAGDDADVSRFAGFNDPDTGYTSGRGRVVHLITPEYLEGNQEPDNVWRTADDWRTEFAVLDQDVIDLHALGSAATRAIFEDGEDDGRVREAPLSGFFPFGVPDNRSNLGPFVLAGGTYISTVSGSGPLMTRWNGGASSYEEVGMPAPNVGRQPYSLSAQPLSDGRVAVAYTVSEAGSTTVYCSLYDPGPNQWGTTATVVTSDKTEAGQIAYVAQISDGTLYLICGVDSKRIMGTSYDALGIFKSADGAAWALVVILNENEQSGDVFGIMVVGGNDRIHITYNDEVGQTQYVQTMLAVDNLQSPDAVAAGLSLKAPWGVVRLDEIHFFYDRYNAGLFDISFVSADAPSGYSVVQLNAVTNFQFAACVLAGVVYAGWTPNPVGPVLISENSTGAWETQEFDENGISIATMHERGENIGLLYIEPDEPANGSYWYSEIAFGTAPPDPDSLTFQEWADWNVAVDQEYQEWYGQQNASDPTTYPERRYYYDWRNEWRNYHAGKGAADPNPPMNQTPPDPYVDPATKEEWCSYNISYFPAAVAWYEGMTAGDPVEYPEVRVWNDWVNEFNGYMDRNDMRPRVH